jgi:hypothetical protein
MIEDFDVFERDHDVAIETFQILALREEVSGLSTTSIHEFFQVLGGDFEVLGENFKLELDNHFCLVGDDEVAVEDEEVVGSDFDVVGKNARINAGEIEVLLDDHQVHVGEVDVLLVDFDALADEPLARLYLGVSFMTLPAPFAVQ